MNSRNCFTGQEMPWCRFWQPTEGKDISQRSIQTTQWRGCSGTGTWSDSPWKPRRNYQVYTFLFHLLIKNMTLYICPKKFALSNSCSLLLFRLYEYQFNDFKFLHERRPNQTEDLCGPVRKCRDGYFSVSDDPWEWSANRVMAPRLAFRMRRLAIIAKDIVGLQGLQHPMALYRL